MNLGEGYDDDLVTPRERGGGTARASQERDRGDGPSRRKESRTEPDKFEWVSFQRRAQEKKGQDKNRKHICDS